MDKSHINKTYERLWIRFAKGNKMKYIGYLELLKIFKVAIQMTKLPLTCYKEFNPHKQLSFAMPLSVGMDSLCEYMELLMHKPSKNLIKDLDHQLPEGIRLLSSYKISKSAPSLLRAVKAADYRLVFPGVCGSKEYLKNIMSASNIMVLKKDKNGKKETDIRQDIFNMDFDPVGAVIMRLSAESTRNLNPMLVAQKIFEDMGICPPLNKIAIVRKEMYGRGEHSKLASLHEVVA